MKLPLLAILALLTAAPAFAQSSLCASLPESGPVASPGPPVLTSPVPTGNRTLHCPDDFRLDTNGRMPQCLKPGITITDGSPRAACYAAMPFGPLLPLPPRSRPTQTCPTPKTTTILRLEGANVGVADAVVTITPDDGITLTPLTASASDVPEDQNPVLQSCFGFECRLLKLDIASNAAAAVRLRVTIPGRDPIEEILKLPEYCPR
nr:hypothetical protein [Polymorphobacter sp.]